MVRRSAGAICLPFPREGGLRVYDSGSLRHEHGSALVEFALSIMILLSLVFGVMAMSLALYSYHFISDAAREGTRYAMVRGSSCSTYGGSSSLSLANCPATSAEIQTYLQGISFPGIVSSNMTVTTTWSTNGTTWSSTPTNYNAPGDLVKVVVSYQFPLAIPRLAFRILTMTSTSQMVIAD